MTNTREAVIISAARTATGKFQGMLKGFTAPELGAIAIKEAVRRAGVEPAKIDEVIMVGDQNFLKKCHFELFEKRRDRALIFASHSPELVREFCDRALVIHNGHGTVYSDVNEALEVYAAL